MDVSKVKSIFIIVFIVLNVFMLVNIGILERESSVSADTLKNTYAVLADRGVTFLPGVEIPTKHEDMAVIIFDDKALDKAAIVSELLGLKAEVGQNLYIEGERVLEFDGDYVFHYYDPLGEIRVGGESGATSPSIAGSEGGAAGGEASGSDAGAVGAGGTDGTGGASDTGDIDASEIEEYLIGWINTLGLPGEEFTLYRNSRSILNFVQKTGDYFIYDNYIEFEFDDTGIGRISCSYRPFKSFEGKEAILPAHQIMVRNIVNVDGFVIQSIELGYKGRGHTGNIPGSDRQLPVWKVNFTNESYSYCRAYDGDGI